jgi:hypothetical protein
MILLQSGKVGSCQAFFIEIAYWLNIQASLTVSEERKFQTAVKAVDKKKKDVIQSIHSPLSESESGKKK